MTGAGRRRDENAQAGFNEARVRLDISLLQCPIGFAIPRHSGFVKRRLPPRGAGLSGVTPEERIKLLDGFFNYP